MHNVGIEKTSDIIEKIGSALAGLTVLHKELEKEPLSMLTALLAAVDKGDGGAATYRASALTSALLTCGARRVSGDIMMDYLLDALLTRENAFSLAAASGRMDDALFNAMRRDLSAMRTLSLIDEETLYKIITECGETRRQNDNAVKLATAAWGGASAPAEAPKEHHAPAKTIRFDVPESCWSYGAFELRDSYCADAALEGMYRRFLENDNWTALVNDLWNFHAAYGSGDFLRYRNFYYDDRLSPLPDLRAGDYVPLAEEAYRSLLGNAIAFLRDESARPMLLYGQRGMGKTTLMLELTDELPQLHLVYITRKTPKTDVIAMLNALRSQPLKFLALFDETGPELLAALSEPMLPMNVLVAACAEHPMLPSLFELTVELTDMQLNDFIRTVTKLLEADHMEMPYEAVRSACVDYQVDTRCEFNTAAAVRVKELLQS